MKQLFFIATTILLLHPGITAQNNERINPANTGDTLTVIADTGLKFSSLMDSTVSDIQKGNGRSAVLRADSCLTLAASLQNDSAIVETYFLLGRAYQVDKKWGPAANSFLSALNISTGNHYSELQSEALDQLSKNSELGGNVSDAIRYRKDWIILNDSIENIIQQQQISDLKSLVETSEIQTAALNEKLNKAEHSSLKYRQNSLIAAGSGLIIVLAVLSFIFVQSNRNKRKITEKESVIQKEKFTTSELEQEYVRKEWETVKLRYLISHREKEMSLLAQELNNGFGSMVTSARQQLEQLAKAAGNNIPADEYLKLRNILTKTGMELKEVLQNFIAQETEGINLTDFLKEYCLLQSSPKTKITFSQSGTPISFNHKENTMICQIVEELVNNINRHSEATEASVALDYSMNGITLTVKDNGKGFDKNRLSEKGEGIHLVTSYLAYLNGELELTSSLSNGATFRMSIPVTRK